MPEIIVEMVIPIVVYDMLTLHFASALMTVAVFIIAFTDKESGYTVDGDKPKKLPVHYKGYHMKVNAKQKIQTKLFDEISA